MSTVAEDVGVDVDGIGGAVAPSRFSTAIYQILERVENKVKNNPFQHYFFKLANCVTVLTSFIPSVF